MNSGEQEFLDRMRPRMRLAYTRSCVKFPRVDIKFIFTALVELFMEFSASTDTSLDIHDPECMRVISELSHSAVEQILSKRTLGLISADINHKDRGATAKLISGLDPISARNILRQKKSGASPKTLEELRQQSLMARRNILANGMVDLGLRGAKYCAEKEATRAESVTV